MHVKSSYVGLEGTYVAETAPDSKAVILFANTLPEMPDRIGLPV
jgi:hypothetical protein